MGRTDFLTGTATPSEGAALGALALFDVPFKMMAFSESWKDLLHRTTAEDSESGMGTSTVDCTLGSTNV